jgi:hypothetical protein
MIGVFFDVFMPLACLSQIYKFYLAKYTSIFSIYLPVSSIALCTCQRSFDLGAPGTLRFFGGGIHLFL